MRGVLFKCPHCGQAFEGSLGDAGMECECPTCGKVFLLEALGDAPQRPPNAFQCYFGIFKKYFRFSGRARRREWWWSFLLEIIGLVLALFMGGYFDLDAIPLLFGLVSITPMWAAQVRRLHDTNKSGWWIFLQFVPVLQVVYYVWLASDGNVGTNGFGPDPKGR